MSNIRDRVVAVTSRVLRLDPGKIRPEHAFASDLGAESVQSIELIAMFEEEFGIEIWRREEASIIRGSIAGLADIIHCRMEIALARLPVSGYLASGAVRRLRTGPFAHGSVA